MLLKGSPEEVVKRLQSWALQNRIGFVQLTVTYAEPHSLFSDDPKVKAWLESKEGEFLFPLAARIRARQTPQRR